MKFGRQTIFPLLLMGILHCAVAAFEEEPPPMARVLNHGAEERIVLAQVLPEGAIQRVHARREKSMWMEWDDPTRGLDEKTRKQKLSDPPIVTVFETRVAGTKVLNGESRTTLIETLVDFEVLQSSAQHSFLMPGTKDAPPEPGMRQCLQSVKGLELEQYMVASGFISRKEQLPSSAICDSLGIMRNDVDHVFRVVFPSEPVGVGAKWECGHVLRQEPDFRFPVLTTYTLVSSKDGVCEVLVEVDSKTTAKDVQALKIVEGTSMDVEQMSIKGKGIQVVDLSKPQPFKGELSAKLVSKIVMRRGENKASVSMDMEYRKTFEDVTPQSETSELPTTP